MRSLDELADLWQREDVRVWVDLESPTDDDLRRLGEIAGLDEEALDDCLHGEQQPRVDEFEGYIFLVLYGLYGLKEQEDLDPHKLAAFCGTRFLITVGRQPLLSVRQVRARCGRHPETLLVRGVDVVLFEIIDTMVDYYLHVIDRYEDRLEALEEQSFDTEVDEEVLEQAAEVRRDLLELRRLAVAQRHLLQPVTKGEYDFISETLGQQLSHVCDHLSQVIDSVDSLRETIVSIRDNYHAGLTRRTNEIMTVLTLYAGIMLPLTLVAGIYGMNLPLWPPSNHPASFWGVLAMMTVIAGLLLAYFRRRKWL
ncbi:MAG: magnesium transporter CorA family protein [Planctomycetaceae bacterium]|nr:magnesium transporter CorA family protein [Planctomycetales bacterium]MCB9875690.1 magnesium transporter CorA family protein [Planctomycetaceae bacterium]MCB9940883.1 magnesium transporter CorA family protein [Planctomycetaceae bacterium]HRX79104.1 magnesium transporter CorA family protein [Pirellulaceae bacterium]